jgi:hypothetical protein
VQHSRLYVCQGMRCVEYYGVRAVVHQLQPRLSDEWCDRLQRAVQVSVCDDAYVRTRSRLPAFTSGGRASASARATCPSRCAHRIAPAATAAARRAATQQSATQVRSACVRRRVTLKRIKRIVVTTTATYGFCVDTACRVSTACASWRDAECNYRRQPAPTAALVP